MYARAAAQAGRSKGGPSHDVRGVSDPVARSVVAPIVAACPCGGGCPRCAAASVLDALEHEADVVAGAVVRNTDQAAGARLAPLSPESRRVQPLIPEAPVLHTSIGLPLPSGERAYFEPRVGYDLRHVRIHADGEAAAAARVAGARAYTVGHDIVFGQGEYAPASARGRDLLAHELVHVIQQAAGALMLQRRPANEAGPVGDRRRGDRGFALRLGRADAALLRRRRSLSVADRRMVNARLGFFEGEAKAAYIQAIKPALMEATGTVAAPAPTALVMSYTNPSVCGGRPCFSDDEADAAAARRRLDDAESEARAIDARIERITQEKTLEAEVYRAQRGTRAHRYARERLETFRATGVVPRRRINIDGGPGPVNITSGIVGGLALGALGVSAGVAALQAGWAAFAASAATTTTAVMTNPVTYMGASLAYGVAAPPGSPDFPGPFDDAGRALRMLGVAAGDTAQLAQGAKVWGEIVRGRATLLPYFIREPGKLVVGVLSAQWNGDQAGIVRAFLVLRQQSNILAKQMGASIMRLEADVVINTETLLPSLLKMGFREVEGKPFTYFLEVAVR